ncbi:MAG: hypothetical protein CBC29_02180 [Methylococcaceae bacterium TMED69]|mgnify:CR=1 FL=1|nr:MAG: hypothetical protein CBC29_02180 [Methylococcaceae bacterium TMED69]
MEKGIFESSHPHKVYFDDGLERSLNAILQGKKNLNILVATNTSLADSATIKQIKNILKHQTVFICDGLKAHSPRNDVIKVSKILRENKIDITIGLGGGSVCDTLKVANIGATNEFNNIEDIDRLKNEHQFRTPQSKLIALPTTLSAGEFTCFAGITNEKVPAKEVFFNRHLPPSVIILDPCLTLDTPDRLFFGTGIRAIDHAVETWCSSEAAPTHAAMALRGFKILMHSLKQVKLDKQSHTPRRDCQIGAWLSVQGVAGGLDLGASHGIGHILGGRVGMPHGETSCVMLPHVLAYNLSATEKRQDELSNQIGGKGKKLNEAISELVSQLGLPTRLRDCNISKELLSELAEECLNDKWLGTNPVPLTDATEIEKILLRAW